MHDRFFLLMFTSSSSFHSDLAPSMASEKDYHEGVPPPGTSYPDPAEFERSWFLTRRFLPRASARLMSAEKEPTPRPKPPPRRLLATSGIQ